MVESSKILTVSYGTFSCTLEGFDDSFGTMKAIAEYFRDLAQGDRYFGAEPPAPDAEMLTRIAEKEIARRVEARADESGIVLRAVEGDKAPAMPPVATPPSVADVAEVPTEIVADPVADAPVADETDSTDMESADATTVAEDGDVAGPETGEEISPTLVVSSPAAPEVADQLDDEMDVTAPAATFADMDASQIAEVPAHPDADSVAAKLQRIRAVVGNGAPSTSTDILEGDLAEELAVDAPAEDVATEIAADIDMSDDFAASDEIDSEDIADETAMEDTVAEDEEILEEVAADTEAEVADVAEDIAEDVDVAEAEAEPEDVSVETEVEDAPVDAKSEDVGAEDAPKQNFRARILRVAKKPAVTEAVAETSVDATEAVQESIAAHIGEDVIADVDGLDDIAPEEIAELAQLDDPTIGTLSDEDEAELMADLAEVEREVEATNADAPSGRDILPEADDAAMSRIMDQADEQLSEPEGSRRRSAIAQLKAAVAATEAARQLGDKGDDASAQENAFRDDLNEAVRPRSASDLPRTQARTARPRPAPLKLVPAQRVDEEGGEDAADANEVAPRRVAADAADAGSFADFAADMGATELPDLLEAAAAYTAYVEGIEDFSRPQIMKKVQASASEEFSREDGLRSFGTLLRQGRISKVRNGRFQVSDQTRFKPAKKAG